MLDFLPRFFNSFVCQSKVSEIINPDNDSIRP